MSIVKRISYSLVVLLIGTASCAWGLTVDSLLGTPYRTDGVVNDQGQFATFNQPEQTRATPGLNCSGLVLQIARLHSPAPIRLADAAQDRLSDSGPESPLGQDWDFGWDLIVNLSTRDQQMPIQILPSGPTRLSQRADALTARGFRFDAIDAWQQVVRHLSEGQLYLVSFSRTAQIPGYQVLHHHVAAIQPQNGHVWLYHATAEAGAHRLDLADTDQLTQLVQRFRPPRGTTSHVLVLKSQDID